MPEEPILNQVFPKPLLKNIVFQIQFPSLFYIESKIGDFQLKILEKFPQSALLYRKQLLFADLGPNTKQEMDVDKDFSKKIWQFTSDIAQINICNDTLDISSEKIKTYSEGQDGFKHLVKYVLDKFLTIATIPEFKRMGFRYINEYPLSNRSTNAFNSMFTSVFPTSRFSLEHSDEMYYRVLEKIENTSLIFQEYFTTKDNEIKLTLDYDCFTDHVLSGSYEDTLNGLHNRIKSEFSKSIKKPIIEAMKGGDTLVK